MGLKVTNNAFGTLNAGINSSATTVVLAAGQGSKFPTLGAGDYFYATLIDTSNNLEIVKVTARSTDTMTIVRAQDNTTARAYSTNDRFELRPTAALFNEKADAADVTTALAGKQAASSELTAIANSGNAMFKNRIINGAMTIDQRNAGASVTPVHDGYTIDRYKWALSQASRLTSQQSSVAPAGFVNSMLCTSSAATTVGSSDFFFFRQSIEGFNVADLGWGTANAKTITLSFLVRSSLTGQFGGSLRNNDGSRSHPFAYTINAANTWEQKSITIAGDTSGTWLTNNSNGIQLGFSLGSGSTFNATAGAWAAGQFFSSTGSTNFVATNGATFFLTGVQLEVGTTATSFDYRPFGTELQLCQRYYATSSYVIPPAATSGNIVPPVTMRSSPTLAGGGSGFTTVTATTFSQVVNQTTNAVQAITFTAEL